MLKKLNKQPQHEMYKKILLNFIHPEHEFFLLARKIDWNKLEKDLESFYSEIGRPAVPVRMISGLLLLKQIFNMSDDSVMERWIENPYWQHFCGEIFFQYRFPFDPCDFVHFRKRISKDGMKRIVQESIHLFSMEKLEQEVKEVLIDTTIQEKNITFPTDRKLDGKVTSYCLRIAEKDGIQLKRTFPQEIKKFLVALRFSHHPRLHKKKIKLEKRFYNITVKIDNDLVDKLEPLTEAHDEILDRMYRILTQQRHDSNKIYSMHEPDFHFISKGKEQKKFEFGKKSCFGYTRQGGIIVGALTLVENPFDGHTLVSQVVQVEELTGVKLRYAMLKCGYKGQIQIGTTNVVIPNNLKRESRYLKGTQGGKTNTFLEVSSYHKKKLIARQRINLLFFLRILFFRTQVLVLIYTEISGVRKNRYL